MFACRLIVKDVKDNQIRIDKEYREDKRRREDTEKALHSRITDLEKQGAEEFQTRNECVLQHAHINERMHAFANTQREFSLELAKHTTQILTALRDKQ